MKFYSQIINKPNTVVKEFKDGTKVVERKAICVFHNGVLETDDPEVIEELKKHPEHFRTDKPWPTSIRWQDTKEGEEILKKAKDLGIKSSGHIRKEFLQKLISKMPGKREMNYQELTAKAKELNIPTHKRKKEDILSDLKQKEVMSK